MKKLITLVVLTALLLTPTLPAWADGGTGPGLLGWFQSWLGGALDWVTGDEEAKIDPVGFTNDQATEVGGEGGAGVDPAGLSESQCTQETSGEGGGCIDPWG